MGINNVLVLEVEARQAECGYQEEAKQIFCGDVFCQGPDQVRSDQGDGRAPGIFNQHQLCDLLCNNLNDIDGQLCCAQDAITGNIGSFVVETLAVDVPV